MTLSYQPPAADTWQTRPAGALRWPHGALDGRQLSKPILGTWLVMVLFSWLSLFWGALISAPFGIGIGIAASAVAGIFVVPLWGTVWGFMGMNAARDSTLRDMAFKEVAPDSALAMTTRTMAERLGIPAPRVGLVPVANAFAMGSSPASATVAIGQPLLLQLRPKELEAVIGHELGHVVSGDMRRMMLMRTFQNATVWFALAQGLKQAARWVICWAAELYILAFSRKREYWADAIGAALTSKEAMIGALRALEKAPTPIGAERTHARFMFHTSLSTHPSTAQRIRALEQETYLRQLPMR
jgi:heat shock protein HtpX